MARRRKWGRRRDDDRVARKDDYALIQDIELDDDLAIPHPNADLAEAARIKEETAGEAPLDDIEIPASEEIEETPPQLTPAGPNTPRVFALVGATGGVGTTSIATQLAHEFAVSANSSSISRKRPTDPTVCLIDLDFEAGACAHHLDLLPSLSLEDLCGPAGHIDTAFTQALVSTHECGVSLLAAPNTRGANARVNPMTILAMLDAASELYDTVVIDLPRYEQPWTLAVMRAVDVLGIICELTIPSLHAARERFAHLAQDANGQVNAQAIMGKYERRSFKNTLRLNDAETALGRNVFSTLCLDPDTTREALNCGEPAGVVRPDSRFVKDVRKLAGRLREQRANGLSKVA